MKGFAVFAVFSITYIVVVLLFYGIAVGAELEMPKDDLSSPSEDQEQDNLSPPKFPHLRQGPPGVVPAVSVGVPVGGNIPPSKNGTPGNPLVDVFQIQDPQTKNLLDAAYGSYNGDDQCSRKSACMLGNYIKELPGKDLMFILMGGYISPEYSLFYDIFRNSALYGQNCNVYVCLVENQQVQVQPPHSTEPINSQPR